MVVVDVVTSAIKYTTAAQDALGVSWSGDGSKLAFLTKDCKLSIWDPRSVVFLIWGAGGWKGLAFEKRGDDSFHPLLA